MPSDLRCRTVPPDSDPRSLERETPENSDLEPGTTDSLVGAVAERLDAEIKRTGSLARLALAESRLAATSLALLLLLALLGAVLIVVVWLLVMALLHHWLRLAGMSTGWALAVLLGVHLIAGVALAAAARKISRHLSFRRTRRALSSRV